jgi:hypothetical protein
VLQLGAPETIGLGELRIGWLQEELESRSDRMPWLMHSIYLERRVPNSPELIASSHRDFLYLHEVVQQFPAHEGMSRIPLRLLGIAAPRGLEVR